MLKLSELKTMFKFKHTGYKNRVKKSYIMFLFDITDERVLRRAITKLRAQGLNIASNSKSNGYWLTSQALIDSDDNEMEQVKAMVAETRSRINKLQLMNEPFANLLKFRRPAEQIKLFEDQTA